MHECELVRAILATLRGSFYQLKQYLVNILRFISATGIKLFYLSDVL